MGKRKDLKMKKAILLYNPKAGSRQIVNYLDFIAERLQEMNYELRLYRSICKGSITRYILDYIDEKNTDLIIISGGDGTINECINGMANKNVDIPILVLPLGTANDFAYSAHIPNSIEEALGLIEKGEVKYVDVGKVNEQYFINVCNMGLFSGISHIVDLELKKKFGKLAYYVKGIEELQNYQAMEVEIELPDQRINNEYILILIFNGKAAGGFTRLAKNASIVDGEFDVIGIKKVEIHDIPKLFLKVLQGEHLTDSNIDYWVTDKINIICKNQEKKFITDVDGEEGPKFPLYVEVKQNLIRFYLPKE